MATASIYNGSDSQTSWKKWTKYFSFPISTINGALNNTSNVPANATITNVKVNVKARYECSAAALVYFSFGIGGNGSISNTLLSRNQIGSQAMSNSETQSANLPIGSSVSPFSISTADGSYFTICISTENIMPKTFWVDSVTLDITYHTHSYTSTVTTQPTCTTTGVRTYTCSCGQSSYTESIPALGHSYVDTVTPPTCTSQGYTTHKCGRCSHSYVDTYVAALGHSWVNATCTTPKTCSRCGATEGSALGHSWVNATCTTPKTCVVCGATEGTALGHSFTNYVSDNNATCTADGTKTAKCDRCSATNTIVDAGSAHGHTEEIIPAVPPACATTGLTEGKKCSVCDEILVAPTEIPHLGHTVGNIVRENFIDSTCTTEGSYDEVHYCRDCGKRLFSTPKTIPKKEHSYTNVETFPPTADAPGFTRYSCSCGDYYDGEIRFTITIESNESVSYGSVSPAGTKDYFEGETITIKATPTERFSYVSDWLKNGESMGTDATSITVTVEENAVYTVVFSRYCGMFVLPSERGRVEISPEPEYKEEETDGTLYCSFKCGESVTLTAIPNDGYEWNRWGQDGSTENPRTFTITEGCTFVPQFRKIAPKFTEVKMLYLDKQISATNKVPADEYFILSVKVQ